VHPDQAAAVALPPPQPAVTKADYAARHAAKRSPASEAFAKRTQCKRLFATWDTDGSGLLEFAELRAVFAWFRQNAPKGELDLESLWEALPESGTLDAAGFEMWLLGVTRTLRPDSFGLLTTRLQQFIQAGGVVSAGGGLFCGCRAGSERGGGGADGRGDVGAAAELGGDNARGEYTAVRGTRGDQEPAARAGDVGRRRRGVPDETVKRL